MKHSIPFLQLIFLFVAAVIALSINKTNAVFALADWQLITGCSQVIIGSFLTCRHWAATALRKGFTAYWLLVIIEFILLGYCMPEKGAGYITILFIIPWALACYFTVLVFVSVYAKKDSHEK